MRFLKLILLLLFFGLASCIQEDIVDDAVPEEIRIMTSTTSLNIGSSIPLEATYFNNVGLEEKKSIVWESANPTIFSIDNTNAIGTANAEGTVIITATTAGLKGNLSDSKTIMVLKEDAVITPGSNTKIGTITPTSSYAAAGDFEISTSETGIKIKLASNYIGDDKLPGFALFLTNNPNSLVDALQVDAYDDEDGAHYKGAFTYTLNDVGINDYQYLVQWCRPFSIKVAEALITDK